MYSLVALYVYTFLLHNAILFHTLHGHLCGDNLPALDIALVFGSTAETPVQISVL